MGGGVEDLVGVIETSCVLIVAAVVSCTGNHVFFKLKAFFLKPYTAAAAKSLQSCPTLCDPRDGSPPVPVILQARTLEWVAISFSNA